ncbi:hypothetical protein ATCC90586_002857 [Pythium insidiosum]|nr:hypothetical protein ATCC90586_002857 [Pythium insidiosum]
MPRLSPAGMLLIAINLGFLAAGVMLINFTSELNSTGWLQALEDTEYKSQAGTLVTAVKALGFTAITLAIVGIVGALTRSRVLLLFYSGTMVISMIVFGVIGGTAFAFNGKLKDWKNKPFPVDQTESEFAVNFNEAYCFAQGAFFCNNASTSDVVKTFLPTVPPEVAASLPKVQGINALCKDNTVKAIGGMDGVCKACAEAAKYAKFDKVLAWAEEKCPRTPATGTWCAQFLATGKAGAVYDNSPYKECRGKFLDVAISWGNSLTAMGALAALAAAILLGLSCCARRGRYANEDDQYKP